MIRRILFILRGPRPDIEAGDFVRVDGMSGVAVVESVNGDHATVAYGRDRRSIVPLASLFRVNASGSEYDRRGGK